MKCITLSLLALLISFSVQADPTVNIMPNQAAEQKTIQNTHENASPEEKTTKNQGADNSQDDNEVAKQTNNANNDKELSQVEQSAKSITGKSVKPVKDKSAEFIKEKWGVGNFKVRQTSAGYMLDVRYRVFDKEKAKPLFSRKLRPFAIEEATNVKYGVPASPKVGFLRQAPQHIKENKEYFLMIANPGKRLKPGDKLTLVIGDFRVEHLTVE